MRNLQVSKEALEFVRALDAKHFKQVLSKVLALLNDPTPPDSSVLQGYNGFLRADMGEYRIVYRFDEKTVSVLIVGKRNDDDVYKKLARKNL